MPFLKQLRHKILETIFLLVVFVLLWVQRVPLSDSALIVGILAVALYIYDHPVVWHSARKIKYYVMESAFLIILFTALLLWDVDALIFTECMAAGIAVVVVLNQKNAIAALTRAGRDIASKKRETVLLLIAIALMLIWAFSWEAVIFLSGFFAFLLYKWDSRIPAAGALVSLTTCPILLSFDMQAYAEQMAVYAYYFLVITVLLQMADSWYQVPEEKRPISRQSIVRLPRKGKFVVTKGPVRSVPVKHLNRKS